jgi:alkanesulfonate monooxygenase SsuD/methylene tetrahydromethanopterin reductase-like flavin-dependent oxidoreductase (luciferase family)
MGAAVKLIHLHHPLDVAIGAAVASHLIGGDRFIFGFGSGFPTPLFSEERGLPYEDRHARLRESLDFILKCWTDSEPFDWHGRHWRGKGVVALPKPDQMPAMATATESDDMIAMAGANGWTLLTGFVEPASSVRRKAEKYAQAARGAGRADARLGVAGSRIVYIAASEREALDQMRSAVAYEVSVQAERGFLKMLQDVYGVRVPNNAGAVEALAEAELYLVGDPDSVAARIERFYREVGGFGTFLIVVGKDWATREQRARSMRLFIEEVAPRLRNLPSAAESPSKASIAAAR